MTTTTRRPRRATPPPPGRERPERERTRGPAGASGASGGTAAKTAAPAKTAPPKTTKPASRTAPAKAPAKRPAAAPVRARRRSAPPRTPFLLLICGLLGGALVSLLLLNTVLAEDAFTLSRLQQSNKLLDQQKEALEVELAREESPERLAQRAEALGMQKPTRPAFIDGVTGQVTGGTVRPVPHAAAAAAGAAGVVGIPGAVVPGDAVLAATPRRQAGSTRP
jgi:hypothetical protein